MALSPVSGRCDFRHGGLTDFVFSRDGETVLTAGLDGFVRFWDLETGKQKIATKLQITGDLAFATLSSDAKVALLEQVTKDASVPARINRDFLFCNIASGQVIRSQRGSADEIEHRELSADGSWVAISNWVNSRSRLAKTVILNRETGEERSAALRYRLENPACMNGCFAPNGKWYAVAGNPNETLQIVDFTSGQLICELGTRDTAGQAFSADGKLLLISCRAESEPDKKASLRILKIPSGEEIFRVPTDTEFDTLALSHNGKFVACGRANVISLIELPGGRVLHQFPFVSHKLQFSPDDRTLAGISSDLCLWDVETGREKLELQAGFYAQMAGSPDGKLIAAMNREKNVISLWDSARQHLIRQFPTARKAGLVDELAFSPDSKAIQIVADKGLLFSSWIVATGKENESIVLSIPREAGSPPNSVFMSPDGRRIVESESQADKRVLGIITKQIDIREINTKKVFHTGGIPMDWRTLCWMPDGKSMLLESNNDLIFMNVANGAIRSRIKSPLLGSNNDSIPMNPALMNPGKRGFGALIKPPSPDWLLPSPDGRLLAFELGQAEKSPVFCILDTLTGKELRSLPLERSAITPNLFWADDRSLVWVTDQRIDTWDVLTGEVRSRLSTEFENGGITDGARIVHATLLPDRRHLFTAQLDHSGLLWDLSSGLHAASNSRRRISESVATKWWEDLASEKPLEAYQAVWQFIDSPAAIPFLLEHLKDLDDVDYLKAREQIVKLDDNNFRVREKAQEELHAMGTRALQAIRDGQGQKPSPEVIRRLESLAKRWPAQEIPGLMLRRLRAIQILERVNSSECQKLLTDLAANAATKAEREEAQAALERLK